MGRVAVITGAAKGLGLACAERFATDGYRLALVDADAAGVSAAADGLAARGIETIGLTADIRDRAACAGAIAATIERFGRSTSSSTPPGSIRAGPSSTSPRTTGSSSSRSTCSERTS